MFALTALIVALQGVGYGPLLTALQGLQALDAVPPIDPATEPAATGLATLRPRHRVRRWTPFSALPPVQAIKIGDEEDEALLMALGVL